jgi:hypothetical protein
MKNSKLIRLTLTALVSALSFGMLSAQNRGWVAVTDFIPESETVDVADAIQKVIDEHPNRTIYFPDRTYLISKPICTPADPHKSVALEMSNFAIIKAAEGWNNEEAMIRLGGKDPYNTVRIPGSNYYLAGGIIDGSGVAKGVSIDSGRETAIRNTSIKNVCLGLHIKHGANSGSSDADITGINITGNNTESSVGVLVEGYDNTFTNIRIGGIHVGFIIRTGANSLTNIHPLFYNDKETYETSCGFIDEGENNWYNFCYSDQFCVGFKMKGGKRSIYQNCFAYWYNNNGKKHVFFESEGQFNSLVINPTFGLGKHNAAPVNSMLEVSEPGGKGIIENPVIWKTELLTDDAYQQYVK